MDQPVSDILRHIKKFLTPATAFFRMLLRKAKRTRDCANETLYDFVMEKTPLRPTMFFYIFREMMIYFLVSFAFFFFIFFVNQILLMAGKILEKHVPLNQVSLLVVYSLPSVIATAAPFSTLVGTLMCLGRMASDNEILSLRALGFSYKTILFPMIAAGLLISGFSFVVNDILLPAGTIEFNKLYRRILSSTPVLELESNSIKRTGDTTMICGVMKNREMDRLIVIDKDEDKNTRYIISSGARILQSTDPSVAMSIDMNNANIITLAQKERNTFDYILSDSTKYSVFIEDLSGSVSGRISPREMSSRDVRKKYHEIRNDYLEDMAVYQRELFDLYVRLEEKLRGATLEEVPDVERELKRVADKIAKAPSNQQYNTYKMEFHMKFALPFGSLCFIFISFPVGVLIKKRGQSTALFSGIIFCFFYWAALILGQTMGYRAAYNGFLAMWGPNIFVAASGLIMTLKVFKK